MKHAGAAALDALEPVLAKLRAFKALKEKNRGTFYRGSSAFIHFHEDPAGLFADLKQEGDFIRYRVNSAGEIDTLIGEVNHALETK